MKKNKLTVNYNLQGWIFLIPLLLGLFLFFLIPMINSFRFSVNDIYVDGDGYHFAKFNGLSNYYEALFVDNNYTRTLFGAIGSMVATVPLVIVFSFFIAAVLNQRFKGRSVFRIIFFLPVIIASAISLTGGDILQKSMGNSDVFKNTFGTAAMSLSGKIGEYLLTLGAKQNLVDTVTGAINNAYGIINLSGIQILIFLTGMESIPSSLYEASRVEGATSWETFWKITFPMISPLILTCVVYTVVDTFTATSNPVMEIIHKTAFGSSQNFSLSSAMAWIYFLLIIGILGITSALVSRRIFYQNR